jgi:hypothetical protein
MRIKKNTPFQSQIMAMGKNGERLERKKNACHAW